MNIDVNKIINGTPYKRILNGYNSMKENYTQESAKAFYDIYSKENLSDILENSRMIFSEPYLGLDFYKDIVLESSSCIFTKLKEEYDKVDNFVNENADKMGVNQRNTYETFRTNFKDYIESVDDVILISSYLKSGENEVFEKELSDIVYREKHFDDVNSDNVVNYINEHGDFRTTLMYTPFLYETVEAGGKINQVISEKAKEVLTDSDTNWNTYALNTVLMNRLNESTIYKESVNKNIHNVSIKNIFNGMMESNIETDLNNIKSASTVGITPHLNDSAYDAISNLYIEKVESELFTDEISAEKARVDKCIKETTEAYFDLMSFEYANSDESKPCKGYKCIPDNTTIKNAFMTVSEKYANIASDNFFEKSGDDNDKYSDDMNDDDVDSEIDNLSKDENDNIDTYTSGRNTSTSSRIKPQKTGNLANKIQTSAQDRNLKTLSAAGKLKKGIHDVANAGKAVLKLPIDFAKGLKSEIHKLDEMDDERRRNYITAPGYRKSILKKLKLAIMYGGAAECNLALVPVLMTYRHFSKSKDRRVRNDIMRELETEIKICDAKIEDADRSDDKEKRWQLIRIREKLNTELIRVTTNSKYI